MINNLYQELLTKEMNDIAEKFELGVTMKFSYYFILCELYHNEEPLSLTDISNRINVKLPNVSNLVNELMKIGLVEQKRDEANKRKVTVQLSEKGLQYSLSLLPGIESISSEIFGTEEEYLDVYEYYKKLHDRFFENEEK